MKIQKTVVIVSSRQKRLSSMSLASRRSAQQALISRYKRVMIKLVDSEAELEELVQLKPDVVLLGMKYLETENGYTVWLADYLEEKGITVTGSGNTAHRTELNKQLAKRRVMEAGYMSSPFFVVPYGETTQEFGGLLEFPLFVKPTNRGGGLGIDSHSVITSDEQLQTKVLSIAESYGADALVEQYLPGREFSVSILKNSKNGSLMALPIELIPPEDDQGVRILSDEIKTNDAEVVRIVDNRELYAKLNALALGAFEAIGGRDYGRIDIRLDAAGIPHFLEANLLPSLIENYGSFPKACSMYLHLSHAEILAIIVDLALMREEETVLTENSTEPHIVNILPIAPVLL